MMGLQVVMPLDYEYNCWNLFLDQQQMKFINYKEWNNLLFWNVNFQCHKLFQKSSDKIDPFFWMIQGYKIEVRARAIEDDWFYCNFGGHWNNQHQLFFLFPLTVTF